MHLLLTDRLTCPRCGPTFGLILLAEEMSERRVRRGTLGCPNCRDAFPVRSGFADLRAPPRGDLPEGWAGESDPAPDMSEALERLMALVGVRQGPGTVALVGEPARHAAAFARALEEVQLVAVDPDAREWSEQPAVSRIVASPGLPFFSRMLRGVVVDGRLGDALIHEAARVTAPRARVVVTESEEGVEEVLESAGLSVLAAESGTVVATRG